VVPALGQLVGCEFIAGVRDIGETTEDAENGDDGPTGGADAIAKDASAKDVDRKDTAADRDSEGDAGDDALDPDSDGPDESEVADGDDDALDSSPMAEASPDGGDDVALETGVDAEGGGENEASAPEAAVDAGMEAGVADAAEGGGEADVTMPEAAADAGSDTSVDTGAADAAAEAAPADAAPADSAPDADATMPDAAAEAGTDAANDAGVADAADAGGCLANIPAACPICQTQNASDQPTCEKYITCYETNNCNPADFCGNANQVCGVNTIGGGTAPQMAALATYMCACP
jgi:hypothetical protein